jgi:hypothetical protein
MKADGNEVIRILSGPRCLPNPLLPFDEYKICFVSQRAFDAL